MAWSVRRFGQMSEGEGGGEAVTLILRLERAASVSKPPFWIGWSMVWCGGGQYTTHWPLDSRSISMDLFLSRRGVTIEPY